MRSTPQQHGRNLERAVDQILDGMIELGVGLT